MRDSYSAVSKNSSMHEKFNLLKQAEREKERKHLIESGSLLCEQPFQTDGEKYIRQSESIFSSVELL